LYTADRRIFDLWLAGWTQDEIAEAVGCDQDTVSEIVRKSAELPESVKPAADHLTDDFKIPKLWEFTNRRFALSDPPA
jgi:transcriptional regulator with XRE-family HTH domain